MNQTNVHFYCPFPFLFFLCLCHCQCLGVCVVCPSLFDDLYSSLFRLIPGLGSFLETGTLFHSKLTLQNEFYYYFIVFRHWPILYFSIRNGEIFFSALLCIMPSIHFELSQYYSDIPSSFPPFFFVQFIQLEDRSIHRWIHPSIDVFIELQTIKPLPGNHFKTTKNYWFDSICLIIYDYQLKDSLFCWRFDLMGVARSWSNLSTGKLTGIFCLYDSN